METLIVAIGAFIGTNIDDIFVNTLLFSGAKTKGETIGIVLGKYAGVAVLTVVSLLAAWGINLFPQRYIRYLGIIPIILGVKAFIEGMRKEEEDDPKSASKSANLVMNTAVITVANGADNIGVYIPLFAEFGWWEAAMAVSVFAAMVAAWCWIAKKISKISLLRRLLNRYKAVIVPIIYIVLGIYMI